jgi:hypothetical protein
MGLMTIYAILVLVGEAAAVGAMFAIDKFAPDMSTMIFAALFFGVLVAAWPLAMRLTCNAPE